MADQTDLLGAFEVHSPEDIRSALASGVSAANPIQGKRPIDALIEAYLRSTRFAQCLQVMLDAGARIDNPLLEAIVMDDDQALRTLIADAPLRVHEKLSLLCAFTSCRGVSPLHICAEFNAVRCARVLLDNGADVNATADLNPGSLGGHTPIFHTVNSILNYCRPMMEMLADSGANLDLRVRSILWGESMSWETVIHDVTPISYAQCGLYRQFTAANKTSTATSTISIASAKTSGRRSTTCRTDI
jgi:hypothetical protein